ncbi:DNA N-6-adenine-methyltransferase [Pseudochrobactrum sp. B5]|uniref:DNA N-6-adenine-methyltransferase n=1 Tax=Pseudochrobactrum sp. B5 TaxID=1289478 RepID=UPI0009529FB5|nr:DNA N-6-adenine-methyltransferase [Pseudochrobactrum sp. B5]
MSHWETAGVSDEWYTPKFIFDALSVSFDLDVAHPADYDTHVPATHKIYTASLERNWHGFIWMNPPFGGRNSLKPWLDKFFSHADGIALTPDRTSAPWWQEAAARADAVLFIAGKVRFIRPDGSEGKSPSNGTTLFASGDRAVSALRHAHLLHNLGFLAGRTALAQGGGV